MTSITTAFKGILLNKSAFEEISGSQKYGKWALLIMIILGAFYGLSTVWYHQLPISIVDILSVVVGIGMVFLTRVGLTMLMWAAGRGLGGPGLLGKQFRLSMFALTPTFLAMPAFIANGANEVISSINLVLALIGIAWMFILIRNAIEVSQNITTTRAYIGAIAIYIFFFSIYFIVTPPSF